MHIVFIEPRFPGNQKLFVQALAEIGATVTAIGEGSKASLDDDLKRWLTHYEEVGNVTDDGAVLGALRFIQSKKHVDRLEATVEAHILPIAARTMTQQEWDELGRIGGISARRANDKDAMCPILCLPASPTGCERLRCNWP